MTDDNSKPAQREALTAYLVKLARRIGVQPMVNAYDLGTPDIIDACGDLSGRDADRCLRDAKRRLHEPRDDATIAALRAEVERQSHAAQGPHDRECNCSICDSRERHENRAEIAALREQVRVLRERAKLLVGECEEQRECPVCGTDTNVEVCRPACYVVKMRAALALTEPKP